MLQAKDLTKKFGSEIVLNSLNLSIAPGEVYCMLGANGAGKTTTINLFMGFLSADGGMAVVDDIEVYPGNLATRERIAYIPEQVMLYPTLTGLQNLQYFSALSGKKHTTGELRNILNNAGLQEEAHQKKVNTYSKGMRQKVGIAIALAKEAKVLLLDEPTSGLDPYASNELSNLISKLSNNGMAILMATHDLFRAKEDGHRIGILKKGKLIREMTTAEISLPQLEKEYLQIIGSHLQTQNL